MLFSLADAAKILAAFERLERIEDSIHNIETDMATFKETVLTAFAYAGARIKSLETELAAALADDAADDAAVAAAEAALLKATEDLADLILAEDAEDAAETADKNEILAALASFLPAEEEPIEEEPVEEEPVVDPVLENL